MTPDIHITIHTGDPNRPWMRFDLRQCQANLKGMDSEVCDPRAAMKFMLEAVEEEAWYMFNLKEKEVK